jgi:hypothetical protein
MGRPRSARVRAAATVDAIAKRPAVSRTRLLDSPARQQIVHAEITANGDPR